MKTLALLFCCGCLSPAFAQDSLKTTNEVYCLLVGTSKMFSNTVTVQVDYGQGINKWRPKDSVLRNEETGEVATFHSMIDALNYMSHRGWTFVNAYAITVGQQNVYHWLLKKDGN